MAVGTEPNLSASLDPLHLLFLTASHRISCPVSWPQVAFLMGMQHDRVVTFIGAGEMPHPSDPSIPILFTVMEYMSGGSLNYRLWDKPHQSVTWRERLTWALDTAEAIAPGSRHARSRSDHLLWHGLDSRTV